jgi:DNA-binding GntR family transcriptional regulator
MPCDVYAILKAAPRGFVMNEEEAALLKKSLPASAFYLEHLFYGFDNRPISWGWFIIPSERLHFTTRVGIKEV